MPPLPFQPVPDCAELILSYTAGDSPITNTFQFSKVGGWTQEDLDSGTLAVADAWEETMDGVFNVIVHLTASKMYDLEVEGGAYSERAYSPSIDGTRGGAHEAINVAMSVKRKTAMRGRSFRGRVFHYGLSVTDRVNQRLWTSASAAEVAFAYEGFVAAIETATGGTCVVVSRYADNARRAEGIYTPVTDWVGVQKVATKQKRTNNTL